MGRLLIMVIPLAVIVYAFIDVLTTPAHTARRGPKWLWALAVLLLPLLGALLWFVLGRPVRPRRTAAGQLGAPDDDPEFLRDLARRTRRPDDDSAPPASAS
ncbi:MAG: PLDc N-terminal domain-containing protein [Actinobacteria bacterium]|nr:PLDc N-terminal domain-containing protein [Actinomycetota bacterium]